jgi:hypothetical protein
MDRYLKEMPSKANGAMVSMRAKLGKGKGTFYQTDKNYRRNREKKAIQSRVTLTLPGSMI